jgi:hypothetical protein
MYLLQFSLDSPPYRLKLFLVESADVRKLLRERLKALPLQVADLLYPLGLGISEG